MGTFLPKTARPPCPSAFLCSAGGRASAARDGGQVESAEAKDLYPVKSNRQLSAHLGERIWYRLYNVKLSIMSPFNRGRLSLAQTWLKS